MRVFTYVWVCQSWHTTGHFTPHQVDVATAPCCASTRREKWKRKATYSALAPQWENPARLVSVCLSVPYTRSKTAQIVNTERWQEAPSLKWNCQPGCMVISSCQKVFMFKKRTSSVCRKPSKILKPWLLLTVNRKSQDVYCLLWS